MNSKNKVSSQFGKTTGLTFGQFLVGLLDQQVHKHRSDAFLIDKLVKEFPQKKDVDYPRYFNMYRNIYNRGEWPC